MHLSHSIQTRLLLAVGLVARFVYPWGMQWLGKVFGWILMLPKHRRRITIANVSLSLTHLSENQQQEVVKGSYQNLGITLAELLAVPSLTPEKLLDRVHLSGLEPVIERANQGQPTILVSGHVGNWEYMALAAGLRIGKPLTIVTHPQSNAQVDAVLNSYRSLFGNILVPMNNAARTIVSAAQRGAVLAFLVDQHASPQKDPWIDFFGRPTPTYSAPAALALRYRIPMFFGVAVRHDDGTYNVSVRPVPIHDLDHSPGAVVELTQRHVRMLENEIRQRPELWTWQHRRWR